MTLGNARYARVTSNAASEGELMTMRGVTSWRTVMALGLGVEMTTTRMVVNGLFHKIKNLICQTLAAVKAYKDLTRLSPMSCSSDSNLTMSLRLLTDLDRASLNAMMARKWVSA